MELVTVFQPDKATDSGRLEGLLARFGGSAREARGVSDRDAQALFDVLKAGKDRLALHRVTRHQCRHDEGVGICTVDLEG